VAVIKDASYRYGWELSALLAHLEMRVSDHSDEGAMYDRLYALTMELAVPRPCTQHLFAEIVARRRVVFLPTRQGSLEARGVAAYVDAYQRGDALSLSSSTWNVPSLTQAVGRATRISSHAAIRADSSSASADGPTNPPVIDVAASRKALQQMYEDADRKRQQSREGWKRGGRR
jgi:hypothetical protein